MKIIKRNRKRLVEDSDYQLFSGNTDYLADTTRGEYGNPSQQDKDFYNERTYQRALDDGNKNTVIASIYNLLKNMLRGINEKDLTDFITANYSTLNYIIDRNGYDRNNYLLLFIQNWWKFYKNLTDLFQGENEYRNQMIYLKHLSSETFLV